jgi:hypothetical protein
VSGDVEFHTECKGVVLFSDLASRFPAQIFLRRLLHQFVESP